MGWLFADRQQGQGESELGQFGFVASLRQVAGDGGDLDPVASGE